MSKSNLCIIGLSKQFTNNVCLNLSKKLDMFYANVEEIMEFELMDLNKVEEVCGRDYLIREEMSIIKRLCTYENTIINIHYSNLNNENNLINIKNNCLIIYLRLNKDIFDLNFKIENANASDSVSLINSDLYEDRDFLCEKFSDVMVECDTIDYDIIVDKIIDRMLKYYT